MFYKGIKGKFQFKAPVSNILDENLEYEITSTKGLQESYNNKEDPLVTIYGVLGIDENSFNTDLTNDVTIVGLRKVGGNRYFYVPATYITTIPNINGVKYVERLLVMSLGLAPVDLDLTQLKKVISDKIKASTNLEVQIKELENSGIEILDQLEHDTYMLRYNALASKEKSYEELYFELVESSQKLWDLTKTLNGAIKIEIKDGTIEANQIIN